MLTTRASLLERLRDPADEAAWGRFVELYTPLMLRWADRAGVQPADAADLIQDVMAVLLQKFGQFRYDADKSFRGWLRTVFGNKLRERARRKVARTLADSDAFHNLAAPEEPDAAHDAEDRQLLVARGLELIRGEFGAAAWAAFWEYAVCGRAVAAVAAELGVSPGTVYAAKSRVLSRLRLEIGFVPE